MSMGHPWAVYCVKAYPALFEGERWTKNEALFFQNAQNIIPVYSWHTLSKHAQNTQKLRRLALCAFMVPSPLLNPLYVCYSVAVCVDVWTIVPRHCTQRAIFDESLQYWVYNITIFTILCIDVQRWNQQRNTEYLPIIVPTNKTKTNFNSIFIL